MLYNPTRFKSTDADAAYGLMDSFPFATMVYVKDNQASFSHLPITLEKHPDKVLLIGHLAKANPHWKLLSEAVSPEVTLIFQGGHTYVTPKWYTKNDVPTWNYSLVHVRGKAHLITDEQGILACLQSLTESSESKWPSGWEFFVPDDLAGDRLTKNIFAFKIEIINIDFKQKLHQGASPENRLGTIAGLKNRSDENSRQVMQDMLKIYDQSGNLKKK